ncbi:MAG: hypothetical protein ACT4QA_19440, partial [Panacagrimonas sp.]
MPRLPDAAGSRSPLLTERLSAYAAAVLESGGRGLRKEELRRLLEQPEMAAAVGALDALMLQLAQASSDIESVVRLWQPPDFGAVLGTDVAPVGQESPELVADPGGWAPPGHPTTPPGPGAGGKRRAHTHPAPSPPPPA